MDRIMKMLHEYNNRHLDYYLLRLVLFDDGSGHLEYRNTEKDFEFVTVPLSSFQTIPALKKFLEEN